MNTNYSAQSLQANARGPQQLNDPTAASLRGHKVRSEVIKVIFLSPQGDSVVHSAAEEQPVAMPGQIAEAAFIGSRNNNKGNEIIIQLCCLQSITQQF